jgi:lipopolysaccharide transport system ATP-binding protein
LSETLVHVENLNKKFCRKLKRSLWYGIRDIGSELTGARRNQLKLRKDEFLALRDVNFDIQQGELVGLIGPNGAGKTTLLKLLSGLIKPDAGVITIKGKIQALIALGAGFNPILTGRENIYVNGAILGFTKKELDRMIEEIVDFSEIGEFIDMPVQSYSSGMHVRLGFSVAVNLKPNILIVDEVLAVGDASFKRKARNKMMELLHSGISVLYVSHSMPQVAAITSRCIYLRKGNVVSIGPSNEVTSLYLSDSIKKGQGDEEQGTSFYMKSAHVTTPDVFLLKDVKIFNASGKETAEFEILEDIKFHFTVEFLEPVKDVSFAISIRDQGGDVILAFNNSSAIIDGHVGPAVLECELKNNRLREGIYNIGFFAADFSGGALFKSAHVKSLTVLADMETIKSSGSSVGYIVLDTGWKVL